MKNSKSKTIIVTGGLGGIGTEIVNFFYNKNYNIIIIDYKKKSFFSKIKFPIKDNFIKYYKIDLSNPKFIKSNFTIIKKQFKKIDILINCAGIQYVEKLELFPNSQWEKIINVNLSSSFYCSKYILPLMKKSKWGRIINISSVHGLVASINKSAYVASKHGLIGLTKTIALETAKLSITCNAICPGWVDTPLISKQIDKNLKQNKTNKNIETNKMLKEKHPNLKFINSKAIASLAHYLCSEEASEITGSSINIDGGWTAQ